jgi:ABC-type transport system involved in multi-copper enzyme maturation permease subunit
MIGKIALKEILGNILTLRFVLSLLLVLLLFLTSGFLFVSKYRQATEDYWTETNRNLTNLREESKNLAKLALYEQTIWKKPKTLQLCAEGFEKSLPNQFKTNVFEVDYPEVQSRSSFILPRFSDVDWAFIVSIILSFVALLLTYDCICGEKEAGTLSLMLAGSLPRYKVILAKYFGAMLTIGIPLVLGVLVNLIVVNLSEVVRISGTHWWKVLAIVLISLLYLSIFILLGMFMSSRTRRSSTSMVMLLLIWVGIVILIPSFGRIISERLTKVPNRTEVDRKIDQAEDVIRYNSEKYGKHAGASGTDHDNPPARTRWMNAMTDARNRVFDKYMHDIATQAEAGRRFTRISPAVTYQCVSEAIVGTGIPRFRHIYLELKRYKRIFKDYILSEDQKDPDSLHLLLDDQSEMVDRHYISNNPVDFDTVPQFQERNLPLGQSVKLAIWDIGLLALFNLVFFSAAFVSFLRYDVR